MPAAAGAVAAAAVADQMLGPKEDRHLAIVLVLLYMENLKIILFYALIEEETVKIHPSVMYKFKVIRN